MNTGYLNVADYLKDFNGEDMSDILQKAIDDNPNRTIFFPDGEYVIDKPLMTSANPKESVSLLLANYAHVIPGKNWNSDEALIRLGGKNPTNDNHTPGSNYGIEGGIIDGDGRASAISIDSGRETFIRNLSIKNAKIGINIKLGANSGSSDADIFGINITGTREKDSVGILVEGCDNTISNVRIASIFVGVKIYSGGNMLRNIHPLYIYGNEEADNAYEESVAFLVGGADNFFDFCYSDQFATGFVTCNENPSTFHNCWCYYYRGAGKFQRGFYAKEKFNSLLTNFKINFHPDQKNNIVLTEDVPGGCGIISNLRADENAAVDDTYKKFLQGRVIL